MAGRPAAGIPAHRGACRAAGLAAAAAITCIALPPQPAESIYTRPDLEQAPVERLVANLRARLDEQGDDLTLIVNLARVHAMAYAKKSDTLEVNRQRPLEAWFGFAPAHAPFNPVVPLDEALAARTATGRCGVGRDAPTRRGTSPRGDRALSPRGGVGPR